MAVIKTHDKIQNKLKDRGKTVMFVGYTNDSHPDTYRFMDPQTKKINVSRDVTWLNKKYGEWKGITRNNVKRVSSSIILDDEEDYEETTNDIEKENTTESATFDTSQMSAKEKRNLTWAMEPADTSLKSTRSQTRIANANSESGREEANRIQERQNEEIVFNNDENDEEDAREGRNMDVANQATEKLNWPDLALYATEMMLEAIDELEHEGEIHEEHSKYIEPKNFKEAWNHHDEYQ